MIDDIRSERWEDAIRSWESRSRDSSFQQRLKSRHFFANGEFARTDLV